MSSCPTKELWQRFLTEQVSARARTKLEAHLETCSTCQQRLDSWIQEGDPREVRLLRLPPDPTPFLRSEARRNLRKEAAKQPAAQATPATPPTDSFLWPKVPGYEILGVLGQGGMGVVYKARHLELKRLVALKMITAGRNASATDRARFRAEAEAVARLQHPNIVQLYEIGEIDGRPFLALEYIDGGTLAQWAARRAQPPLDAARVVECLARAMQVVHRQGLVHRDLKPANILIAKNNDKSTLKITDFGLVRQFDTDGQTSSGAVLGTPGYMAPEQAQGRSRDVCPATDVHALGAILYELLTGRPPFVGETAFETMLQICSTDPAPPSTLRPGVPRDLETICLKCLQKEPARRYPNAASLAEDLKRWCDRRPIQARRLSSLQRFILWGQRQPIVAALILTTIVVGLLGFVGVIWKWKEAETARLGEMAMRQLREEALDSANTLASTYAVGLAHREWQVGHLDRAERYLQECPERHRHWEWHYLKRLCHADLRTFPKHIGGAYRVAFSSEGRLLATAGVDRVVRVYRVDTGQPTFSCPTELASVSGLAFEPGGRRLAAIGLETGAAGAAPRSRAYWWDTENGRELHHFAVPALGPGALAIGPAEIRALVLDPERTINVFEVATGKLVRSWTALPGDGLQTPLAGSGNLVAACVRKALGPLARDVVFLWDIETGDVRSLPPMPGHSVQRLSLAPGGRLLAVATRDRETTIWRTDPPRLAFPLRGHTDLVEKVVFGEDGRLATAGADQTVKIWDPSGRELFAIRGHASLVLDVAFGPLTAGTDTPLLATASFDGTVKLWDATGAPDGRILHRGTGSFEGLAFSKDGTRLGWWDSLRSVQIREVPSGREVSNRAFPEALNGALFFARGGRSLAAAARANTALIWDLSKDRKVHLLADHPTAVAAVAFSPDGRQVATSAPSPTLPGIVCLWDLASGRQRRRLNCPTADVLAFSPDGKRLAAAGGDNLVWIFDTAEGQLLHRVAVDATLVRCLVFSPDGSRLLVGGAEGMLAILEVATARELLRFHGHTGTVSTAAFSPDGCRLASAGQDKTIKIWDPTTGRELLTLTGHKMYLTGVAFSPDGHRLASTGGDGTVRIWDGTPLGDKVTR